MHIQHYNIDLDIFSNLRILNVRNMEGTCNCIPF